MAVSTFSWGQNPKSPLYNFWNEVGALEGKEFVNHEYMMHIEGDSGKRFILYCDIDKLEEHMLELSPEDSMLIKEFTNAVRNFSFGRKPATTENNNSFSKMSLNEFAMQFKDPFLREVLPLMGNKEFMIMTLAVYNNKDAVWPVGGSLEFARGIEKRFLALGGRIQYNAKVDEIIVKDDRAAGVRLADGSEHPADFVISAADGYNTIFHMLHGNYVNDEIRYLYTSAKLAANGEFDPENPLLCFLSIRKQELKEMYA